MKEQKYSTIPLFTVILPTQVSREKNELCLATTTPYIFFVLLNIINSKPDPLKI